MCKTHSGQFFVNEARKAGLRIENGKGSHCKVYGPAGRGLMIVPLHKELGNGLECSIKKWLKLCGVVLALAILVAGLIIFAL